MDLIKVIQQPMPMWPTGRPGLKPIIRQNL